ncbi:MAG: T9SS type A sorting domain-containing protein [Bacteroidales bacterium]
MVIPIGFQAGTNGLNTITVTELFGFSGDINVVLEDIKEGKFIELDENSVYEFIADPSDEKYRFNLLFKDGYNNVADAESNNINIYSYGNVVYIQKPFETMISEVTVYDIMGQVVLHTNSIESEISKLKIYNGLGYYLVKATTEHGVITKKVFIK